MVTHAFGTWTAAHVPLLSSAFRRGRLLGEGDDSTWLRFPTVYERKGGGPHEGGKSAAGRSRSAESNESQKGQGKRDDEEKKRKKDDKRRKTALERSWS